MKQTIVSDPAILMGKPVVSGTRISVELILEKLAAGETVEQILEAHPRLTRDLPDRVAAARRDDNKRKAPGRARCPPRRFLLARRPSARRRTILGRQV